MGCQPQGGLGSLDAPLARRERPRALWERETELLVGGRRFPPAAVGRCHPFGTHWLGGGEMSGRRRPIPARHQLSERGAHLLPRSQLETQQWWCLGSKTSSWRSRNLLGLSSFPSNSLLTAFAPSQWERICVNLIFSARFTVFPCSASLKAFFQVEEAPFLFPRWGEKLKKLLRQLL